MIKSNELRFGNIVEVNGELIKVKGISEKGINPVFVNQIEGLRYIGFDEIKPIPLTEEIILRCGFKKRQHVWNDGSISHDLYWNGEYYIVFDNYFTAGIGRLKIQSHQYIKNIKTLNELQNLYFYLTAEELIYNE